MIYLYGLMHGDEVSQADALGQLAGLQAPVRLEKVGAWCLAVSDHDAAEILPKRRNLLTHTRVVEQMMTLGTVLPARFGLVADDLAAISALLFSRAAAIDAEFARLSGLIELGVRISYPRQAALEAALAATPTLLAERDRLARLGPEAHFARADFGRALADTLDRRRGEMQKRLLAALVPLVRDHVLRKPEEDTEVLRCEVLLPQADQAGFTAAIAQVAADSPFAPGEEPQIQIIGPVPMYNFVRLALGTPENEAAA